MSQQPPAVTGSGVRRLSAVLATLIGLSLVVAIGVVGGRSVESAPRPVVTVALALAIGDLGDRAFNDSAYAGLQRAQRELGARFLVEPFRDRSRQADTLRELAQGRPDLVIALGFDNAEAVSVVAAEFPEQTFAIVDAAVEAPNVTSIVFRELEGDFLAGALTALLSPRGAVGFLGGADVPVIRRIEHGWRQGVLHVNSDATILAEYISTGGDRSGFGRPDLGRQLTAAMFERGAEVVYTPAGGAALGGIEAASAAGRLVITTGVDQRYIAPEAVVASRTKNMGTAVYSLVEEAVRGALAPGTRELDLFSDGVGLTPLDDSRLIPAEARERMAAIEAELRAGRIQLTEPQP
ncbi:MAG TPA: BMP family ABC transporter substrate-binding protein [Chloroflexaceae bacterium]|nr:BMP family ABC transporter substrate-binding protein [Chloroflexaceae bacterium]